MSMRRWRIKMGFIVAVCFLLASYVFGGFSRTTYTYTCEICKQRWQHNDTMLWRIPFWQSRGVHVADDHEATYRGGGYSRAIWFLGGTGVTCGVHGQVSGKPDDASVAPQLKKR